MRGVLACAAVLTAAVRVASAATYTNPVLAADFPDPAVLRLADGSFVAFATGGANKTAGSPHIQVATSPDLVRWTPRGDALPQLPAWACQDCFRSCAPDVSYANGTFYLYFVAYLASSIGADGSTAAAVNCIGVATSAHAAGPYVPPPGLGPVICDSRGVAAMDPKLWEGPYANGTRAGPLLFVGSHGKPIVGVPLDASRTALAPGAAPVAVLGPDASAYGGLVEGPWVYALPGSGAGKGPLGMWYSGNQCCGPAAHYAASFALSPSGDPLGPWVKQAATGPPGIGAAVLRSDAAAQHVTAPGHNAVVRDDEGVDWVLYHANAGPQCAEPYCARQLFLDRLWYNASSGGAGGWPWTNGPTWTPQPAPVIRLRP